MATEKKCWTVDIEHGFNTSTSSGLKNWALCIESRVRDYNLLSEERLWKNALIYKVPAFAADLNRQAFTPQLVSFGPYHHDSEELKLMEVHKVRALVHFIRKAGKPLGELVAAVESVVQKLQDSYYRLDERWRTDKEGFLRLMITDGCFMLEVLRFAANVNRESYSPTDPFFSEHGNQHKMPYIRRDMLLIENQLPLLLLKTLVSVENPEPPVDLVQRRNQRFESMDHYINDLVLNFFNGDDPVVKTSLRHHALDLYRQSLLSSATGNHTEMPMQTGNNSGTDGAIRCAVELRESGIKFRKSDSKSLRDIHFCPDDGILYLPYLLVDDATEYTLLNMVAFEHLHTDGDHYVSSYVCFMGEIIGSARDVSLLHSKGIIQNSLGSDKAVARVFNHISRELTIDPDSCLVEVRRQVRSYCQKRWNRWRANLLHTYFRSPWSALALAGALLVIVLAITQTAFAILDYYYK